MNQLSIPKDIYDLLESAELIFWDFDGVIKDSLDAKAECFLKIFEQNSHHPQYPQIKKHHLQNGGISRYVKIPLYLEWLDLPYDLNERRIYLEKLSMLTSEAVISCPYFEDVKSYLEQMYKKQNFVLITATPEEEIKYIVKQLDISHYFKSIYGSPMPKDQAIKHFRTTSPSTYTKLLMVGDTLTDANAATAQEVPFILKKNMHNAHIHSDFINRSF